MTTIRIFCLALLIGLSIISCTDDSYEPVSQSKDSTKHKLFEKIGSEHSGLDFNNRVKENYNFNHIRYDVFFQGGGVCVGDLNNDGLQDVYFTSNMESDKIYLNKGNLKFEDVTQKAGIAFDGKWSMGATMVDINTDGFLDIYVCKYLLDDPNMRENLLYVHNGIAADGSISFTEKAKEYGIADNGFSTMANFFDYNQDGLLDLYVGNQPPVLRRHKKKQISSINYKYTDHLYKNNGNGTFTDVTQEAGITNYNFTLSVNASDLNNDGLTDIYIASDYEEPDIYYQNNGDGTFTNVIHSAMKHLSTFSMGVDIADINNDGWMDLYVADMVAADNQRLKANMSGMNPEKFWSLVNSGYHLQYMFNAFQLNNGNGTFSEIGQIAGVSNTDWSWSTLFADYDNDGQKDLVVTNGLMKDIKNNDYQINLTRKVDSLANLMRSKGQKVSIDPMLLVDLPPSEKLSNYVFRNNSDLTFNDMSSKWGLDEQNWTNGAAYADFDNDGDVDLLMNHMNQKAGLYRNNAVELQLNNYFRTALKGPKNNEESVGARVWIYYGDEMQVQELFPVRGYISRNEPILHFGLGEVATIDKLIVRWPDGKGMELKEVSVNQVLSLNHKDAKQAVSIPGKKQQKVFSEVPNLIAGENVGHIENTFDDFKREILIPHKMSHLGPSMATGDLNGDQLDDIFLGGASGSSGVIYLQNPNGSFQASTKGPWQNDKNAEDVGVLFFDADQDNDLDIYVSSGGNEFKEKANSLQDRLYINNGNAEFTKSNGLPKMLNSSSKAKAADFDKDGDLDLFVGGRQIPGKYGLSTDSYLLENQNGKFVNVTDKLAPELSQLGMVTDAIWTDFDQDEDDDLIIVGEWMPITFFENKDGNFENITATIETRNTSGWWNTITQADFDKDGDMDYVFGNLGTNSKYKATEDEPFKVFLKDFDNNGTHDVYLAYYDQDGQCYPVRGRECSSQQMPFVKKEFTTYKSFSEATVDEVLGNKREGAIEKSATMFESIFLENKGSKTFVISTLPNAVQVSPIFGTVAMDVNNDNHIDIVGAGNYYHREVETIRSDAGVGFVLLGDGEGNFKSVSVPQTGLVADKDVRDVKLLELANKKKVLAIANNNGPLEFYKLNE